MSDRDPPPTPPLLGCGDEGLDDLMRELTSAPPVVAENEDPQVGNEAPQETVATIEARMQVQGFEFPRRGALEAFMAASTALGNERIIGRLRELQQTMVRALSPDPRDYITTREEVCALNLVLNERRAIAPALRPYKRAAKPSVKGRFFTDRWVIGDRMVIDLHWLWTARLNLPSAEMRGLFEASEFSFEDASGFARARIKMGEKANAVGLSEVAMLLTTSFRSPPIRDRLRTIDGQMQSLRQTLLDHSHSRRYRLTAPAIEELQAAARALLIARGSATVASDVVPHIGGASASPDRMRDIKKRLGTFGMRAGSWGDKAE